MLDIGGTLVCKINQSYPGVYQINIPAESLGIMPGEGILMYNRYLDAAKGLIRVSNPKWYIRLYASYNSINKHKRKQGKFKIPYHILVKSKYYNEMVRIDDSEKVDEEHWFVQEIKASVLLPIIKERSKIQSSLIYADEYWRT